MKDRYLFRGKCADNGEWAHGYYLSNVTHSHPGGNVHAIGLINPENREQVLCDNIDSATIGQYTGIDDKHGKLIFEGDIVRDEYGLEFYVEISQHFQQTRLYPVNEKAKKRFGFGSRFGIEIFNWIYPEINLEIIGNIHDNSELIKREEM